MRKLNYLKLFLFAFFLMSLGNNLSAQEVLFDNNARTETEGVTVPHVMNDFAVPAGTDRLLVVVFSTSTSSPITPPQITFGGTNMQQGALSDDPNDFKTATYYLPLGTGSAITNNVAIVGAPVNSESFRIITAFSLQLVNQTAPVVAMADQLLPNNNTTNLNLTGTTKGSMIIESLTFSSSVNPSGSMPQSGQTIIENNVISANNFPLISFLSSPGGAVNLGWIHGGFNGGVNTAMAFDFSGVDLTPVAPVDPIPTMSEWGLLIFGLLILNLGLVTVYRMENA